VIAELGSELGVSGDATEHFVESVRSTLLLTRPRQFLDRHNYWFGHWMVKGPDSTTPPIVGLLSLFSYAATQMKNDRTYFPPLADLLGVDDVDALSGCYNRHVRYYWNGLNTWVERFGRGTPTAYPQDIRANVSLLLTQRFLSSGERAQLSEYFSDTGLAPGTSMPLSEMEDILKRTRHLIPMDLRDEYARHPSRLAEVAMIELENWDGSVAGAEEATTGRLLVGAYFDREGKVDFPLAVAGESVPPGEFFFEGSALDSPAVAEAVTSLGGRLTFDAGDGIRFARGPRLSDYGIAKLLGEDVSLSDERGFNLTRTGSEILLLLPRGSRSYIESPARLAPLGSPFTLLVTTRVADDPEFQDMIGRALPAQVSGVPRGMVMFRDLEFATVPAQPVGQLRRLLRVLVPSQQDATVDIRGGIPLAGPSRSGRAWLACDPPEIVVSATVSPIEVFLHVRPAAGEAPSEEQLISARNGRYSSAGGSIVAGDHQLFVIRDNKTLSQRKLRLVSSDLPRLPSAPLGHDLVGNIGWATLSADRAGPAAVRGGSWDQLQAPVRPLPLEHPPTRLEPLAADTSDSTGERLTLAYVSDLRPDSYRRRRVRPKTMTQIGPSYSVFTAYAERFEDAITEAKDEVATPDGRRWRLKYYENDEVSIGPVVGFVPMTRYRLGY
jgi:hypothetical protein